MSEDTFVLKHRWIKLISPAMTSLRSILSRTEIRPHILVHATRKSSSFFIESDDKSNDQ